MARPLKSTVDYFPHLSTSGKTIFTLESKFGNDGYAFWFKLLELLAASEGHVYDYNNPADWQFMLAKTHVSEDTANDILQTLVDLDAIDTELAKQKIIWCQNFVDGIADAYRRRQVDLPQRPGSQQKSHLEEAQALKDNPELGYGGDLGYTYEMFCQDYDALHDQAPNQKTGGLGDDLATSRYFWDKYGWSKKNMKGTKVCRLFMSAFNAIKGKDEIEDERIARETLASLQA